MIGTFCSTHCTANLLCQWLRDVRHVKRNDGFQNICEPMKVCKFTCISVIIIVITTVDTAILRCTTPRNGPCKEEMFSAAQRILGTWHPATLLPYTWPEDSPGHSYLSSPCRSHLLRLGQQETSELFAPTGFYQRLLPKGPKRIFKITKT